MSNYVAKKLRLMDEVNSVEVRNYPEKTVIVASLFATHTDEDEEAVSEKAHSLGFYGGTPTSLRGSYALKFAKRDRVDGTTDGLP